MGRAVLLSMVTAALAIQQLYLTLQSRSMETDSSIIPGGQTESFPWSVVDWGQEEGWQSWESLGLQIKTPRHNIHWKRCTHMDFAWSGVMRLETNQHLPLHTHAPAEIYYILRGKPTVSLDGNIIQCWSGQVVSIPAFCPHSVTNNEEDIVLIAYTYLPRTNTIRPGPGHQWKFLEEV